MDTFAHTCELVQHVAHILRLQGNDKSLIEMSLVQCSWKEFVREEVLLAKGRFEKVGWEEVVLMTDKQMELVK